MTINDTWGFKSYDTNFKSTETLLRNLIDIASKGGNYLLNIGPDSHGIVPQPEVDRLHAMGAWLAGNGEADLVPGKPIRYVDLPPEKARETQLVFVRAGLAVSHFSLQQLPQPGRRGELFLAQGRQALLQCARHTAQAQGLQLFGQLLGLHDGPRVGD